MAKSKPKPKRIANTNAKTELQASKLDAKAQQVIELYFTGITQREIGERLGLSIRQVFKILQDTKNLWHEWKLDEWDMCITGELARIDRVEAEAWAAWGRSQLDAVEQVTQRRSMADGPDEVLRKKSRSAQYGQAAFLKIALECVDQRCKLLGAYDAAKIAALRQDQQQHGNTIPQGVIVVVDTPEQANQILGYSSYVDAIEK